VVEVHTLLNCIVPKKGTDKANSMFTYAFKQAFWGIIDVSFVCCGSSCPIKIFLCVF
jgi:hypothetical protein